MMGAPETQYVDVGGHDVAYQVIGEGDVDLLYCWGLGSHVDMLWDRPGIAEFFHRLAGFSRLILFDQRGTGASDRIDAAAPPTWQSTVDDIKAVLDVSGSTSTYIYARADAAAAVMLFAARHPERVRGLVLANTSARYLAAEDYPIGVEEQVVDSTLEWVRKTWGTEQMTEVTSADYVDDREFVAHAAKMQRASLTPRTATSMYGGVVRTADLRAHLNRIEAPVLVLHNERNPLVPVSHGEYLAQRLPNARLVVLDAGGLSQSPKTLTAEIDLLAEFVTGERAAFAGHSFLTTLLISDIVDSTGQVSRRGDENWRGLLDGHDRAVRASLRRFGGTEVNSTGDGQLSMFDSPGRAVRCAWDIIEATARLGLTVRVGVHTGECVRRGNDLAGITVHTATRIANAASGGQVLVSDAVRALVSAPDISFVDAGTHALKGIDVPTQLFEAVRG